MTTTTTTINPIYDAVVWYDYEETSGAVIDSTGNHNGTNYGVTTGATGKLGNAYDFTTSSDYLEVAAHSDFQFTSAFTISAWFYPTALGWQIIAGVPASTSGHSSPYFSWALQIAPIDATTAYVRIFISHTGGLAYTIPNNANITTNQWYHVVCTFDGTYLRTYLNGSSTPSAVGIGATTMRSFANPVWFGKNGASGEQYYGKLSQFILYHREITSDERAFLYNSGNGVAYPTGPTWETKPLKFYNGSTWESKPLKAYEGGSWVTKSIKNNQ